MKIKGLQVGLCSCCKEGLNFSIPVALLLSMIGRRKLHLIPSGFNLKDRQ